ncbi:MAG: hypothetical protein ACRCY8_08160 [Dermatophilaceae bacterium]
MASDPRPVAGHGLVLVRRPSAAVTRWMRRGLVSVTVAPFGTWTGVTLVHDHARSAAPYDVGLEVLAARPAPLRCRPALGFFDVHGRAVFTVQAGGLRGRQRWLVWEPGTGTVDTPDLSSLRLAALLELAGAAGRVREEQVAEALRSRRGSPLDVVLTVLGLLGLPGRELMLRQRVAGSAHVEPSARGVVAFDRLVAEEAETRADRGAP